jgi:hypothetical protein
MIALTRVRTVAAIPPRFRGAQRLKRARALLELHQGGKGPKSDVWKVAKNQLRAESDGKCAYCEGKASHVAHGDVEHYRPKSKYWWLAYCYDNYLYACQVCNQSYKGNEFPVSGSAIVAPEIGASADLDALAATFGVDPLDADEVAAFVAAAAAELAGIPDPYSMDPEPLFAWKADDTLREVEIRPRNASPEAKRAFAAVKRYLGLNRDELKRWRYEIYSLAMLLADVLAEPGLSAPIRARVEHELREMMSVTGEFAGMVRYFIRNVRALPL